MLIKEEIMHNLLSSTLIMKKIGPMVLDKTVVEIIPKNWYKVVQTKLDYFSKRSKEVYVVNTTNCGIFVGVAAENVS